MKIPLLTGAYQARSIIAEAQRCVNLYPEKNPEDSPFPTTHYETPGLTTLVTANQVSWRALYLASTGVLFGVCGNTVYTIGSDFSLKAIGTIGTSVGPVVMKDNTADLIIVDGTSTGYSADVINPLSINVITNTAFYGADRVDYLDGYFVLNRPGTSQFYVSPLVSIDFDPLDFASKSGAVDRLVSLIITKRYIYLFGTQTTEIWANTGAADFTFGRMDGTFIEHGCVAKHSVAKMDGQAFWLGNDEQGRGIVMQSQNLDGKRISTHAMETAFQRYSTLSDAIGMTYQTNGHYFYVLTFPTANKTWSYDLATGQWHEWVWFDPVNGKENRSRIGCIVNAYGQLIAGDWENGKLYKVSSEVHTDDTAPIVRIRSFPHLLEDGDAVHYRELMLDMEVGRGLSQSGDDPQVSLRWSDDKGASWGNPIMGGMGATGEYLRRVQFQRLGRACDRVFEVSWSTPNKTALNGAYLQTISGKS